MPTAAATTARRPMQKAVASLRWLYLLGVDIVAYGLLVADWAVGFGTATPSPRRLKQEAVAALRWLYFLVTDIVVYGSLAALWVAAVGGVLPEILGRWVCGEDSAVTAAGEAVLKASKFVIVRFLPGFITQFGIRFMEFAQFEAKERRDKLATSSSAITEPSAQRQRPERKGVQRLLPWLGMSTPLLQLGLLGMRMKKYHEQGFVSWKIGYVLSDVAALGSVWSNGLCSCAKYADHSNTIPREKARAAAMKQIVQEAISTAKCSISSRQSQAGHSLHVAFCRTCDSCYVDESIC